MGVQSPSTLPTLATLVIWRVKGWFTLPLGLNQRKEYPLLHGYDRLLLP